MSVATQIVEPKKGDSVAFAIFRNPITGEQLDLLVGSGHRLIFSDYDLRVFGPTGQVFELNTYPIRWEFAGHRSRPLDYCAGPRKDVLLRSRF